MDKLLVETKELKPEYQERNRLWEKYYKRFCLFLAHARWKPFSIIHYSIVIDIEIGMMKYYYFKYGMIHVIKRIKNYHTIIAQRVRDRGVELDPKDFHVHTLLTNTEEINDQLNKELLAYV